MGSYQEVTNDQQDCVGNPHVYASTEQPPASWLMLNIVFLAAFWESEGLLELSVF